MVVPKKRNGYYYINGKEYVSVTKVIQDVLAKPALLYWYGREATRIALKNPELNEKEVMSALQQIVSQAGDRGHKVHDYAVLLSEGSPLNCIPEDLAGYVSALAKWFFTIKPIAISSEMEVVSEELQTAGRLDYICKINGETWLIDYKSGKEIYKESGIQLAFYKHALHENHTIKIQHTGVVLCMDTGEYVFKETNDTIEEFRHIREIWNWVKKKER